MVVQLIYISTPVGTTIDKIDNFMMGASERNIIKNITSIILVTPMHYIHCIEGDRHEVSKLYNKLVNDPRHTDCTILRLNEMPHREFSEFSAEISNLTEFDTDSINTVCLAGHINPCTITSSHAMTLLRRVAAHKRANRK